MPEGSYEDKAGNPGEEGTGSVTIPDTTAPQVEVVVGEDGKITITYPKDVNPETIETGKITVDGPEGPITVDFDAPVTNDKGEVIITGQVPTGVDGEVTVTVPEGSYEDKAGNPGEEGNGQGVVDSNLPIASAEELKATEDTNATGIIVASDPKGYRLTYTLDPANKPGKGEVIVNKDTGEYTYIPDHNYSGEDSFKVIVSNGNGGTTVVEVPVSIEAVADTPLVTESMDFNVGELTLNRYVWKDINGKMTIGGKVYDFNGNATGGNGNGNGINPTTLVEGINALLANKDKGGERKPILEDQTTTLKDPDVKAGEAVLINGLVYLEEGTTYTYKGQADDSGMIIIGNGFSSQYVSWAGPTGGEHSKVFTVDKTGFYDFNLYVHNESNIGNYDFKVTEENGTDVKYYPSVEAIQNELPDFIQLGDKDTANGLYEMKYGYAGSETDTIKLEKINAKLTDTDGSEILSVILSGLPKGTTLTVDSFDKDGNKIATEVYKDNDGKGIISFTGGEGVVEYKDFVLTLPEGADVGSKPVTVEVIATEKSKPNDPASDSFTFDLTVKDSDISAVVSLPEMLINRGSGASTTTMQVNPDKIANIEVINPVDKGAFPGFSFKDDDDTIAMDVDGNVVIKGAFGADILPEIRITDKGGNVEIIKMNSPVVNGSLLGSAKPKEDTDDTFTYELSERPKSGEVNLNEETGEYIYTPNADYIGKDTFVITVYDASGKVATHESGHPMHTTVPIMVIAANDVPDTAPAAHRAMVNTIDEFDIDSNDEEVTPIVASNDAVLYTLLSGLESDVNDHSVETWDNFVMGNPDDNSDADSIKFSEDFFTGLTMEDLLSDGSSTVGKFITVDYDAESQTATISVDRDGEGSGYTNETLLHLTNQDSRITLDDLLENNQVVIG